MVHIGALTVHGRDRWPCKLMHTFRCLILTRLQQGGAEWQARHAIELRLESCEGVRGPDLLHIDGTADLCYRTVAGANVLALHP